MSNRSRDNLIPNSERTPSQRRENARKAGIASGKARAEKKKLKDIARIMLEMEIGEGKKANIEMTKHVNTLTDKKMTVAEAMMMVQVQKALKGNHKAFEVLRDLIGENPNNKQETQNEELSKLDELLSQMTESIDE